VETLERRIVPSFTSGATFGTGTKPLAAVVADVNRDGRPDLVVANDGSDTVSLLLGNGNGTFQAARSVAVSISRALRVGDINVDSLPDLVMATYNANSVSVLLGQRDASTHFQVSAPASATAGTSFTITVTALTASGQTDTNYTGTVQFTSSDPSAVLPAAYHFTLADGGTQTFTVTLNTTGKQTIAATDKAHHKLKGKATITVKPAAAAPPPSGGPSRTAAAAQSDTPVSSSRVGDSWASQ
jgi:hypothetical protein